LILALILAAILSVVQPGSSERDSDLRTHEYQGALDVRIHPAGKNLTPPAELLLSNSRGEKIGRDPRTDQLYSQIPNSYYESESLSDTVTDTPGPETRILYIRGPLTEEHTLWVIGTKAGTYHLEIRGYDLDLNPSDVRFLDVKILENQEHRYLIRYKGGRGANITAIRK
jgi:hypothetical protein